MKNKYFVLTILELLVALSPAYAGEVATFESFYTVSGSGIGWIGVVLGATLIGAIVFFTGGLASPFVAGPTAAIGTWVGGMMGGAAAICANLSVTIY